VSYVEDGAASWGCYAAVEDVMRTPTLAELRQRRDEILHVAAKHGAQNVRVFGSVVRGDARPDSDIDLLVELDSDRSVLDLSELILDLQDLLGRHVDIVETQRPSASVARLEHGAVLL
jgi:predicted nucleotidyltransferase